MHCKVKNKLEYWLEYIYKRKANQKNLLLFSSSFCTRTRHTAADILSEVKWLIQSAL